MSITLNEPRVVLYKLWHDMGQVMKLQLSCYLVLLSIDCHLPHNTPHIPSRYNNEQTTKQTKAIYIYIHISCKCDTNVPDISTLMPMHQDPLLVSQVITHRKKTVGYRDVYSTYFEFTLLWSTCFMNSKWFQISTS